ncbi:MAG: hypothetical protein OXG13_09825 [Gemmatimonadaceae bacterium]|nr:hypothetical protein [Gemmatimonadaceae bacterium]
MSLRNALPNLPIRPACLAAALVLLAVAARAQDTLHLDDGTEVHGTVLEWSEEGVKLRGENGVISIYPASMVVKMTRPPPRVVAPKVAPPATPPPALRGRKEPWVAIMLSGLLPGLGQYYNGERLKAAGYAGAYLVGMVAFWPARDGSYRYDKEERVRYGAVVIVTSTVMSTVGAALDAHRINKKLEAVQLSVAPGEARLAIRF